MWRLYLPLWVEMTESAFECFLSLEKVLGAGAREGENRLPRNHQRNIKEEIHPWYGQYCKNSDLFQFQLEWNNGIEGNNFFSCLLFGFFFLSLKKICLHI